MKEILANKELYSLLHDYGFVDKSQAKYSDREIIEGPERYSKVHLVKRGMHVRFDQGGITLFIKESVQIRSRNHNIENLFSFLYYTDLSTKDREKIKYLLEDKKKLFDIDSILLNEIKENSTEGYKSIHKVYKADYIKQKNHFIHKYF